MDNVRSQMPCNNACIINSLVALNADGVLEDVCGNVGAGHPGAVYPVPIDVVLSAGTTTVVEIKPKTTNGLVPFCLLVAPSIDPAQVKLRRFLDGNGDLLGIKGDGISTEWPIEMLQDPEIVFSGLPVIPPDVGLIDASRGLSLALENLNSVDEPFTAYLFGIVPKKAGMKDQLTA